jgi:hypothetical protein
VHTDLYIYKAYYLKLTNIININMPKWNEVNMEYLQIETGRGRPKFNLGGGQLKFQIPRGTCQWGYNPEYKSFQVSICDTGFIEWFRDLEQKLCTDTPYRSNLKDGQLRLKADDSTLFFGPDGVLLADGPERMKGADVSCIMEISGSYFFQDIYGLTCRATQVRIWSEGARVFGREADTGSPPGPVVCRRALLDD